MLITNEGPMNSTRRRFNQSPAALFILLAIAADGLQSELVCSSPSQVLERPRRV
jgi:hypothetical protein